jgi:rRNA maturation endonuclease Nob1
MLIALGRGDKYRLAHIRETLEIGKELYISDKDFLEDLVKTHLKDKIYQARIVSISEKSNLFCEECGSEISADEKFCTSCGTEKPEPSSPSTSDVSEPTPEPEIELDAESGEQKSGGFTFTDDGKMVETITRKTIQRKPKPAPAPKPSDILSKFSKKSRQQELEEYEKKYLNESETKVSWKAYDVKAKKKVEIQNPKAVKMKNGKWAVKGTSPITGIKVFRIVGNEKPDVSVEKTVDSPKVKKEQTAPAEKPKGSQKTEPEVFSRYYRSTEAESPKVKKPKSKKPNLFCEECGSKIAAKDMFCINCGAKR